MADISYRDVIFYHGKCFTVIHTDRPCKANIHQCLGNNRVAPYLFQHKIQPNTVLIRFCFHGRCILANGVQIQQVSVW